MAGDVSYMAQNECIYNLLPKREKRPEKKRSIPKGANTSQQNIYCKEHISKYDPVVSEEKKSRYRTMGKAHEVVDPCQFLKKGERSKHYEEVKKENDYKAAHLKEYVHDLNANRKPAVPTKDERPVMGVKTKKDFKKQNVVESVMSVPKQPPLRQVITRKGAVQDIEAGGLVPTHIYKGTFGEVPQYIKDRKEQLEQSQNAYKEYLAQHMNNGEMDQLCVFVCATTGKDIGEGTVALTKEEVSALLKGRPKIVGYGTGVGRGGLRGNKQNDERCNDEFNKESIGHPDNVAQRKRQEEFKKDKEAGVAVTKPDAAAKKESADAVPEKSEIRLNRTQKKEVEQILSQKRKEEANKRKFFIVKEEQRDAIIAGLKANLDDLHREYQLLSVSIDTIPKRNKKERIENEMKALEKDIELIEKHKIIYISNRNEYCDPFN